MSSEVEPDRFDPDGDPPPPPPPAASWRRRRLRVGVGIGGVVVVVAVAIVLLAGGGGGETAVARAAAVTTGEPGFKFTLDLSSSLDGSTFVEHASGAITERPTPAGSMSVTASGKTVDTRVLYPDIYIQSSPPKWIKFNLDAYAHSLGLATGSDDSEDPTKYLAFLRAAGSVTDLGRATIGGVATTHYHALADLDRYAAVAPAPLRTEAAQDAKVLEQLTGSDTLPVDAWVDAQDRVRRIVLSEAACSSLGSINETIAIDFFDYGPQPPITPPAGAVSDITSQMTTQAAALAQTLHC